LRPLPNHETPHLAHRGSRDACRRGAVRFAGSVAEAVEGANWKLAAEQVNLLDTALVKNTELLRSAKSAWEKKE
jgi:hypothetical protein